MIDARDGVTSDHECEPHLPGDGPRESSTLRELLATPKVSTLHFWLIAKRRRLLAVLGREKSSWPPAKWSHQHGPGLGSSSRCSFSHCQQVYERVGETTAGRCTPARPLTSGGHSQGLYQTKKMRAAAYTDQKTFPSGGCKLTRRIRSPGSTAAWLKRQS